jgi:D-3-phosphoglycerate dehydrogenase / 2-oxoglutarate reductase
LISGSNAVNFPSITAEEAPKLRPFIALASYLRSFAGQLVDGRIEKIVITYEGVAAGLKTKALTGSIPGNLLKAVVSKKRAARVRCQAGCLLTKQEFRNL